MGLGTDTPAPFTGAAGGDKDHTLALAQHVMGCERAVEGSRGGWQDGILLNSNGTVT